ncbi:MAG: hypothetical protein WC969_06700 [Elusimicrobiota bacterium]
MKILLLILAFCGTATANDGFFAGAGSTLSPVRNESLRVIRETLTIAPIEPRHCWKRVMLERGSPDQRGKLTEQVPCSKEHPSYGGDDTRWRAEAVYEIEAKADAPGVQFGFPTPVWDAEDSDEHGDLTDAPVASAADFRTFIDGRRVEEVSLKWLDGPEKKRDRALGFVWTASFTKGKRYTLKSTYEFSHDYSVGFYGEKGAAFREGAAPWFILENGKQNNDQYASGTLIYYLTPLKQWGAPPPEKIRIEVTLPSRVSMTMVVPISPKPRCVGVDSLVYELRNAFPEEDLRIAYPADLAEDKRPKLAVFADLLAWRRTLGGGVRITCALRDRLIKESGPAVGEALKDAPCEQVCRP